MCRCCQLAHVYWIPHRMKNDIDDHHFVTHNCNFTYILWVQRLEILNQPWMNASLKTDLVSFKPISHFSLSFDLSMALCKKNANRVIDIPMGKSNLIEFTKIMWCNEKNAVVAKWNSIFAEWFWVEAECKRRRSKKIALNWKLKRIFLAQARWLNFDDCFVGEQFERIMCTNQKQRSKISIAGEKNEMIERTKTKSHKKKSVITAGQ